MRWIEIRVHTRHEAEEAVAHILHETGAGGVVIEPRMPRSKKDGAEASHSEKEPCAEVAEVVLKAYLPESESISDEVHRIRNRVSELKNVHLRSDPGIVTTRVVDDQDWENVWKQFYEPVRISERIVVKPTWKTTYPSPTPRDIVLELDPGMAFGTGTHPSTILSLRALERTVKGGERMVDVGCGSGILSIAAAKLGASHVCALDIDELAVRVARENVIQNNVQASVDVHHNDLLHGIEREADIIVANILAHVIISLTADAALLLNPGGWFIASGIVKAKEWDVQRALIDHYFVIMKTLRQDDWVAIIAQKR